MQMKNNKDTTIHSFDKGLGFALLSEKSYMQKIKEQPGKVKIAKNNPILKFTYKIQKILRRQKRKEKKFTDREYFQIYPADPIPPRLYGTIKAHKPENYPTRTIVSTIGTPAYGLSKSK